MESLRQFLSHRDNSALQKRVLVFLSSSHRPPPCPRASVARAQCLARRRQRSSPRSSSCLASRPQDSSVSSRSRTENSSTLRPASDSSRRGGTGASAARKICRAPRPSLLPLPSQPRNPEGGRLSRRGAVVDAAAVIAACSSDCSRFERRIQGRGGEVQSAVVQPGADVGRPTYAGGRPATVRERKPDGDGTGP